MSCRHKSTLMMSIIGVILTSILFFLLLLYFAVLPELCTWSFNLFLIHLWSLTAACTSGTHLRRKRQFRRAAAWLFTQGTIQEDVLDAGLLVHAATGGEISKCPYDAAKMRRFLNISLYASCCYEELLWGEMKLPSFVSVHAEIKWFHLVWRFPITSF